MPKTSKLKEARARYAVEIDPAKLEREPIVIKRDGKPIGAAISIEEFRSYSEWKKQQKSKDDFPPEWRKEKAAFQKMLPQLLKTHREKFVAIYQGQVVDSDEKEGELMFRMGEKYGNEQVYIDEVVENPRVFHVASAWYKIK